MGKENITAYRLTAEDATAQAWASAQRNASESIGRIQSLIPGLAAALSAAGLVEFARHGIDAADGMNDLSKSTGIGVEKLAGFQLLAKQTGTDLEGLAKAVNKMSVEVGKDPEKFRALGITATDNTERFKQFADLFNKLPDIAQRNALANAVFGKSWAEVAPALSEGGKRIGEIIEKGSRLSGLTQEMAEEADKFNDKWAELTGTGALFNRVIGPALPLLNSLADSLLNNAQSADKLHTSLSPVAESLKTLMILGANVSFVFNTMGADIARAAENVKLIAKGDFAGSRALSEIFRKDAEERRKALDEYEKQVMAMGLKGSPEAAPPGADPRAAADASRRAAEFLGTEKSARDDLNKSMRETWELTKLIIESENQWDKAVAETIAISRKLEDQQSEAALKLLESQSEQENAAAVRMERIQKEADKEAADKAARQQSDLERLRSGLMTENEIRKFAYEDDFNLLNATLGMKKEAQEEYYTLMGRLVLRNEKQRTAIEDAEIKKRYGINQVYRKLDIDSAGFFFNQMSALMSSHSRKAFEVGKAAAIADTVVQTYVAAQGAYAALAKIPIVGPALGIAAAAAATIAGFARVSAIKSQSFGSGSGAVGTFSANPNTGLPESPISPAVEPVAPVQQTQAPRRDTFIHVEIVGEGLMSTEQVRSLIGQINEANSDGVKILVN